MPPAITRSNPPSVKAPTGYTHAIQITGDYRRLIISGQVGMALDGTVPSTGEGQIAQALANLRAVLTANGMGVENIVKTTAFLTDRGLLGVYRQARGAVFGDHTPASTLLFVAGLADPAWVVEIEAKQSPEVDLIRRNTVGDAIRRAARLFRDRPALVFGDRSWSFHDLDRAADRVAGFLVALGLKAGDRIAAYGRNSDAYFIAWLACVRGGFVHVPVNYALTDEELSYIVCQSGSRLVLAGASLFGNLQRIDVPVRQLEDLIAIALDSQVPSAPEPDLLDDSLAQIVYTSGTTAAPKGAMMTHKAMMSQDHSVIHNMDYAETDRALAALPLYHTAQTHAFTMPQMLVGITTILIEAPAPDLVLRLIEQQRITSFFAPPTVWISLLRHPDFATRDLGSLEKVYYGASIMPVPVLRELRARLPQARPYNCYGQTEIAPLATVLRPEEHDARPASCGRPCLNVQTRVVDPQMNDVPPGTHGEIVHRSPHLMVGYWEKPDETAEAFAGGWFHSGDVGYFDDEGYLYIVDRIRDVINTGGVLVASREVEEILFTHPAVSEVAVVGLPDEKWIEAVTAFVVLRPGQAVEEGTLIALAREHLAPDKLPKKVVFVDTLPRNTAGKLLKRELRKQYS